MADHKFFATYCLAYTLVCCLRAQAAPLQIENAVEDVVYVVAQDGQCLGPEGFETCEWSSAWIYAKRKDGHQLVSLLESNIQAQCIGRKTSWLPWKREFEVGAHKCTDKGTNDWDFIEPTRGAVYVTQQKHKYCMARGRKQYRHTASMVECKREPDHLAVETVPQLAMVLETGDGMCLDGQHFKLCESQDPSLLYSIGLKYDRKGRPHRYIYKYHDPSKCLVATKTKLRLGSCTESGALDWGWKRGHLVHDNGRYCIARLATEDTAVMTRVSNGCESITMITPAQLQELYVQSLLYNNAENSAGLEQLFRNWQMVEDAQRQQQQQQQQYKQPEATVRTSSTARRQT